MTTWRTFTGNWDDGEPGDWTYLDQRNQSWTEARDLLAERLHRFDEDTCATCREYAATALQELAMLPADTPYETNVDGDDFVLVPESTP